MLFDIMLRAQASRKVLGALSRAAWLLGPAESSLSWSPPPIGAHAAHSSAPAMAATPVDKAKQSPSAFKLFLKDFRKGEKSSVNFFKRASADFKIMPEVERKHYEEVAAALKASAAAQALEQAAKAKQAAKQAAEEIKLANQGKHTNAYSKFVKASFHAARMSLPEGAPTTDVFQKLAEMWRAMTLEEKSAFGELKSHKTGAEKPQGQ